MLFAQALGLERRKEALHCSVVPAVAATAHAANDAVGLEQPLGAYSIPSVAPGVLAVGMDGSDRNRNRGTAAEARSRDSSSTSSCSPDQKDPCEEIRKKIRDIEQKLASKERQMAENKYNLYNRAYDINPGGDLAGKGTWVGHMAQIDGLRVGLERAKAQAQAMGCL